MDSRRDRFRGWLVHYITSIFPKSSGVPDHLAKALYEGDPEALPLFGGSLAAWRKESSTWPEGPLNWPDSWPPLDELAPEKRAKRLLENQSRAEFVLDRRRWKQGVAQAPPTPTPAKRKGPEEEKAEAERLARERVEFKEMMEAKREAKLAARAVEEEIAAQKESNAPLPPTGFVYFIRNGGLFKIGITENMLRRMGELAPDELLNVVRCSNFQEVERELHRRFKDVRLPQTEYFRLSDQQVQEVHQLMVKLAEFPS